MMIYEVNLEIEKKIEKSFKDWMGIHIEDMMKTGHFKKARSWHVDPTVGADENLFQIIVHYEPHSEKALEDYMRDLAPKMRADGANRFGGQFKATRRILHLDFEIF
jgi:hypothetical protein